MEWIKNLNRVKEVEKLLDKLIVGERENKMVLFFNFLSCLLDQPNGTILTGEAASGKTHLCREVLKLFPNEWKIIFGGVSKKALIHMRGEVIVDRDEEKKIIDKKKIIDFSNKILWFLEDTGGEETYTTLRPILSRDQDEIRFEFPTKKLGKGGSEFFLNDVVIIKGCPAFVTTSTKIQRLPETGTRVFQLSPDESYEQSEKIVKFKLDKQRFLIDEPDYKDLKEYIKTLKPFDIWIPYTDIMYFVCHTLNIRRDIDKVLALTKVVTLFNQYERRTIVIKNKTYLISTLPDYLIAMDYAVKVLNPTLFNIPPKIEDFFQYIKKKFNDGFSHKDIASKSPYAQSTVKTYCWQLVESGRLLKYLEGRENRYSFKELVDTENAVTLVTLKTVTPNLMVRSILDVKSFLELSVTQKERTKTTRDYIINTLIYVFSVTCQHFIDFDTTSLQSVVNEVTTLQVTHGNANGGTCRLCGAKINNLTEDLLCPICAENEKEIKEEKNESIKST